MNFDNIILSDVELKRLRKLNDNPEGLPYAEEDRNLREEKLIDGFHYTNSDKTITSVYRINKSGKAYLKYYDHLQQKDLKDFKRYAVSTAIAIIALIISLIALTIDLLQLGWL